MTSMSNLALSVLITSSSQRTLPFEMAASFLSIPLPCCNFASSLILDLSTSPAHNLATFQEYPVTSNLNSICKPRTGMLSPLCVRSFISPAPIVSEDLTLPNVNLAMLSEESIDEEISAEEPPLSGCKTCGKKEVERGCNGEGRIQGGIATVPGFGWWPIKAYRPCPGFLESGGRYKRQGQSMDEVAFGGGERGSPTDSESSDLIMKEQRDPRKFKR